MFGIVLAIFSQTNELIRPLPDMYCVCIGLQGEVIHWLACSLYVACRKSIIPTVGKGVMEGNCVSLTRILRSAKLR
jgi:hypothetical protein